MLRVVLRSSSTPAAANSWAMDASRSLLEYELRSVSEYLTTVSQRYEMLQRIAQGEPDRVRPWDAPNLLHLWDWFPPTFNCPFRSRLGRIGDGGKVCCNVAELAARRSACAVLSFGVRGDISFEIALAREPSMCSADSRRRGSAERGQSSQRASLPADDSPSGRLSTNAV